MKCLHSLYALTRLLEEQKRKNKIAEHGFAEQGFRGCLADFCGSLELIEDYETAIKILKQYNKGGEPV